MPKALVGPVASSRQLDTDSVVRLLATEGEMRDSIADVEEHAVLVHTLPYITENRHLDNALSFGMAGVSCPDSPQCFSWTYKSRYRSK